MISVIIPTYKRPIELERAIKSALAQVDVAFEILVVNDCKEDTGVKALIDKLNDKRIIYLDNERTKGGNGSRNTAIGYSKGGYLAFLDDDDEWYADKLKEQLLSLNGLSNEWGGAYCAFQVEVNDKWTDYTNLSDGNLFCDLLSGRAEINAGSTLFIKKSVVEDIGLFAEDLVRHQDLEFLARFFAKYKIAVANKVLAKIYGHNITKNINSIEQNKLIFLEKIKEHIHRLPVTLQNRIYAYQFRELAVLFAMNGDNKKALHYLKKSISYGFMFPTRYISVFLYAWKNSTGIDMMQILNKVKYYLRNNKLTSKILKNIS